MARRRRGKRTSNNQALQAQGFPAPPPLSQGADPNTVYNRETFIPQVVDTFFGGLEGVQRNAGRDYRLDPRTTNEWTQSTADAVGRSGASGQRDSNQPQANIRVQPAPGVNPRFEGTPDNFAEFEGRDFRFNPMMDELDDVVPANIRVNRGGVWYWHPYN